MEPEGLRQPATYPYPEPDQSSPYPSLHHISYPYPEDLSQCYPLRGFSLFQIDSLSKFCITSLSNPNHPQDQPIVTSYISLQYINQVICIYQAIPHYLKPILATCPAHTKLLMTLLKWDKVQKTQQCCSK